MAGEGGPAMSEIKSAQASALSIVPGRGRSFPRWIIPVAIALAIVGVGMATAQLNYGAVHVAFHPHAPDLGLLLAQPTVIQVHLLAALAAIGLGGVMMLSRKGALFHRTMGWVWVSLMALVAGSSLFITGLNGDKWSFIHLLSGWTLIVLPIAVLAARRHDVKRHRRTMMGLFYGGLLLAGALAFIPGRLMWQMFLG
jgi:uncharacterized membrane protein